MILEILPTRSGGAAENMAVDFLLLQRHPRAGTPWFRHYGWHRPAFTFGYSQKISFVRAQLPSFAKPTEGLPSVGLAKEGGPAAGNFDLCRRPTGGGVVDHRDDWTYALVIPRGHPLEELRATQSYREIHEALAAALRAQGVPAVTKPSAAEASEGVAPLAITMPAGLPSVALAKEGVCFQHAEIHDVIHEQSGAKIAGAAQKRNKRGLLFQGSIWRPATGNGPYSAEATKGGVDWDRFHDDFVAELAKALGLAAEPTPWPEVSDEEVSALVEHYSTPEWNEFR